MSAVLPQWQISMRLLRLLVCSSQNATRARLRSCHPRRNRWQVLQDICSLCPFGEIVARGIQRMATIQCRVTRTPDRFVGNVLQFDRPPFEKIDGVMEGGDLHNRETSLLYENGTIEKLVVHLILRLVSRGIRQASRKYEFCGAGLQGVDNVLPFGVESVVCMSRSSMAGIRLSFVICIRRARRFCQ